jgi:5,10-methylene-tetrahydrofolate dehydrogenase/methenyl tetrahydrofolate cyclohydrolase
VLFTNDNVLSCLLSLLQLNEGEPVMFLLKNHPDPSTSRCYNSGKQDNTQIQAQADVVIVVNKTRSRSKNKML